MTIFEPEALFGLVLTQPYVTISPVSSGPYKCQFLYASYLHGRSGLSMIQASSADLGEVALLERVKIGTSVASVWGCANCAHPVPTEMTWTTAATHRGRSKLPGTFVVISGWSNLTLNHVIDLARSMTAVALPPVAKVSKPNGADETTDAHYVLSRNKDCPGYPSCALVFLKVSDGHGRVLIAVDLVYLGPTCYTGIGTTYFFLGTRYLASTMSLAPRTGVAPSEPVWVNALGQFGVNYPVSSAFDDVCADRGDLGVDSYIYKWNGTTMVVAFGQEPKDHEAIS
jgi:hypothetical protein